MFYIAGKPIIASEIEVLQELKSQLALQGIYRFDKFIETENHIQFNCPIHKGGQERKPSCGITKNRIVTELGNGNKKITEAGTVHCFQCGYTTSLPEMISDCFGKNDMGMFGHQWLAKNFLTVSVQERKPLELDLSRNKKVETPKIEYITEEELDSYRYIHPYMYQRKLTDEVINMFDVGYDKDFTLKTKDKATGKDKELHFGECITFPIRDEKGNVLFIARRSIHTKMFHYPNDAIKPVYGLYELPKNTNTIIICESIFNALTCYVYGIPAVALNGTGTPLQMEQLSKLPCREFILGLDPDSAGERGIQKIKKALGNKKLLKRFIIPTGKDINDLSKEEFDNLPITFV